MRKRETKFASPALHSLRRTDENRFCHPAGDEMRRCAQDSRIGRFRIHNPFRRFSSALAQIGNEIGHLLVYFEIGTGAGLSRFFLISIP